MKNADAETIGSSICGAILFILGLIGTVIALLSLYAPARPFLHVTEFRVDLLICGPMLMLLAKTLLNDLFKRESKMIK